MYEILQKKRYHPQVVGMVIAAPLVARHARPGQFVMLRVHEKGERIPLTISGYDRESGTVSILFQEVGKTTMLLGALEPGDCLRDIAGPLGNPTPLSGMKNVCVIGGGLGCAIAYPLCTHLHGSGARVDVIAGFRTRELVFLEEELRAESDSTTVCTDDGTHGVHGLVTTVLQGFFDEGRAYDHVIAIGPMPMMKFVCKLTKAYNIPTSVSLNSLMIDGTGMCGCCRVTVDGETKFACVDGPDFDGHRVDFDEALRRGAIYRAQEKAAMDDHICKLGMGGARHA